MVNQSVQKATTSTNVDSIMAQIKWKFQSMFNKSDEPEKKSRLTEAFAMTRQSAYIYAGIAAIICGGAIFYGYSVYQNYKEMNQNIEPLKILETYSVSPNDSINPYIETENKNTIDGMLAINENINTQLQSRREMKETQENYYKVLLQNIYLPSLNVWKNPYTKAFDPSVLWQKYLDADKFQTLYLIQYWSDFIKDVGNDVYNQVETIEIWGMEEVTESNYFYVPITVTFTSPNKRSFLLLVNKLSTTSNVNNVALLNEFFFYLIASIKENKYSEIEGLMQEYWTWFMESDKWDWFGDAKSLTDLTPEQKTAYQDKIIGLYLYNLINEEEDNSKYQLIDDAVLVSAIRQNVSCDNTVTDPECFYNFRDKYRSLPYLAYGIGLQRQASRTEKFIDFLQDLPSIISITEFWFEKTSSSTFLSNTDATYEGTLKFNAYWRWISSEELDEAANELWKLCFGQSKGIIMSADSALNRINENISSLWSLDSSSNITDLEELQLIITDIQESYQWMSNYQKMIKLFELWRMLNDANLCTL